MALALDIARIPAPSPMVVGQVSPSDGVVSLGPIQQRDLDSLFVWLNDARAATLDLPYRPLDCLAFRDWLDGCRARLRKFCSPFAKRAGPK